MVFDTLTVRKEGTVLFANIAAPPMNLLGPELVRDLVSLIQRTEGDDSVHVVVFTSADPDYFISHVDVTRISEYRHEAATLTGEASIALLFRYLSASRLVTIAQIEGRARCAGSEFVLACDMRDLPPASQRYLVSSSCRSVGIDTCGSSRSGVVSGRPRTALSCICRSDRCRSVVSNSCCA
jgi:enoyl-CoA hydratase/carnithine racemase